MRKNNVDDEIKNMFNKILQGDFSDEYFHNIIEDEMFTNEHESNNDIETSNKEKISKYDKERKILLITSVIIGIILIMIIFLKFSLRK